MVLVTLECVTSDLCSGLGSSVMMKGRGRTLHVIQINVAFEPFWSGWFQKSIAVVVTGGMVMVVVCTTREMEDFVVISPSSFVAIVVSVQATSRDVVIGGKDTVVGSGRMKGGRMSRQGGLHSMVGSSSVKILGCTYSVPGESHVPGGQPSSSEKSWRSRAQSIVPAKFKPFQRPARDFFVSSVI